VGQGGFHLLMRTRGVAHFILFLSGSWHTSGKTTKNQKAKAEESNAGEEEPQKWHKETGSCRIREDKG